MLSFVEGTLGRDWWASETARINYKHPIIEWYEGVVAQRLEAVKSPEQAWLFKPSGQVHALYALAWDMYVLEVAGLLPPDKIARLRNRREFQGVRHELFAAAAFVRANFDVEWIDESLGGSMLPEFSSPYRPCDFVACYRPTGRWFSVEAKCRHQAGYQGARGQRRPLVELRLDVLGHVKDALRKHAHHERVIVLDLNLPNEAGADDTAGVIRGIIDQLLPMEEGELSETLRQPAYVLCVNQSHHFKGPDPTCEGGTFIGAVNMPEFHGTDAGGIRFEEGEFSTDIDSVHAIWREKRKRWPEVCAVFESMNAFSQWPHDFGDGGSLPSNLEEFLAHAS